MRIAPISLGWWASTSSTLIEAPGGGFILSPSDHFFDAEPTLIAAFADEARQCVYAST